MELAAKITELTERNRELAQFKEEHDKQVSFYKIQNFLFVLVYRNTEWRPRST